MLNLTNIYIIQDSQGLIKIGHSTNVSKRIKHLQTAHGVKLKLLASAIAPSYIEKRLHKMFFFHRKSGEWFSCSYNLIKLIIEYLSERYPTTIYEEPNHLETGIK